MAEAAQGRKAPPRLLMRVMNVIPRLVLRSPLHGLMDGKVLLLGFTGCRSGRHYTTPMSYVRVGDEVFMTTEAPLWKNLAGGAPVEMRLAGRSRRGFAETLTREEDIAEVLRKILRHYPEDRRFIGVAVDEQGRPEEETILAAARSGRVGLRVRLDSAT